MRLTQIDRLVANLFKQKWSLLHDDSALADERLKYPGVYLLAYTELKLSGKRVRPLDVFYVGMSNSAGGTKQRLKQFRDGIETGDRHSGADRFFREYAKKQPYSKLSNAGTFFFVAWTIPCTSNKSDINPSDLRVFGHVCGLEYYVIAHVFEKSGRKPPLNKLGKSPVSP